MEIYALGTGNAFTKQNWQSNFLIRHNNKWLMIDCGSYSPIALKEEMDMTVNDIDAWAFTHIHADHANGFEEAGFCTYFSPTDRPKLFIQGEYQVKDGEVFASGLAKDLWEHNLKGGMSGLEHTHAELHTYFDVNAIPENGSFVWEGVKFDFVQTVHVSARYKIENSYGLMWTDPDTNERVYFTADTQFCPVNSMTAYLAEADVIFHDCETSPFKSNVHSHYEDLRNLDPEIKSKIWLYHYHDNVINDWDEWSARAKEDGFRGFTKTGYVFGRDYKNPEAGTVGKLLYNKIKWLEAENKELKCKLRELELVSE